MIRREAPTSEGRPLSRADRLLLWPPFCEAWYALRWIGMRDRLRCPHCRAVGTWKPHGTWPERVKGDRPVRRWMCKWCGLYLGPEGRVRAFLDPTRGHWALPRRWDPDSPETPLPTPADVVHEAMGKAWPWRG